jgi:hypothetical protein
MAGSLDVTCEGILPFSGRWLSICALILVYLGLWLQLTPYGGMGHDAQAYAMEALARLHPVPFAHDLFLQYRSQEEFTLFPALYAPLIEHFGLETAAAAAVFVCQLLWYSLAFLLFRRVLGTGIALFSIGLLITVSGTYGAFRVFHMAEPFLTARLPGEVISLAAIWLYLSDRKLLATLAAIAAMAIHPLIALPVAALLVCLEVGSRWSAWYVVPVLLASGVMAAVVGSFVLGGDEPFMTGRWLAMTKLRSGFLFVQYWRPIDWNDTLLNLLTLSIGGVALASSITRRIARTVTGIALAGLALAIITNVLLPLEVLIQGQPWRWIWVSRFFAIGLLPAILVCLWSQGRTGRACSLLLVGAWIFVAPVSAQSPMMQMLPTLLAAAALLLWIARAQVVNQERIIVVGATLICGLVAVSTLGTISVASAVMTSADGSEAMSANTWLTSIFRMLTPAALLAVAACTLSTLRWGPWRFTLVGVIGMTLVGAGAKDAFSQWTSRSFSGNAVAQFADWRELIPTDAEVLWYDNLRETWFLLERRAYLTRSQSGGIVFSEGLAEEVVRRALVLEPYIDPNFWIITSPTVQTTPNPLTEGVMQDICRDPELSFVVSEEDIGSSVATKEWPAQEQYIYLYDCGRYRSGSPG